MNLPVGTAPIQWNLSEQGRSGPFQKLFIRVNWRSFAVEKSSRINTKNHLMLMGGDRLPMHTEATPDELPLLALGRGCRAMTREGTERHGKAALVRKAHGDGIAGKGNVIDAKVIHGSGFRRSYTNF